MPTRLMAILTMLATVCAPLWADRDATITVHPDQEIGPVNRLVFGNNMLAYQGSREVYAQRGAGIWDPDARQPVPEYVALSKLAGVSVHRWPGGCGAHNYNWKLTVGPLADRPDQQFGLPEFMAFCEATDAVALLTVAVYWGEKADAADLVEYLNSPLDGGNPNGGQDWAAVRAGDGHPEPYEVVWFEYGNESYHGEHKTDARPNPRSFPPAEYCERYLGYRAAMRAVDPRIKLGALLQHHLHDWNEAVLKGCGDAMDFGIEHTYTPGHKGDVDDTKTRPFMQACLASDAKIQGIYDSLLGTIEEITGRTDVPLAITEYNGWFVQARPIPYRQAFANALRNAEHLRVMLQPRNRILMANFWQYANEYWGMVQGYVHAGDDLVKQANFYPFQMYAEHFGDTLVEADVQCDTWDFEGIAGVASRKGDPTEYKLFEGSLLPDDYEWEPRDPPATIKQTIEGQIVTAEFSGDDVNYYAPRVQVPAESDTGYRIVAWVKTDGLDTTRGAGCQVGDARGWTTTQSCSNGGDVRGTTDWSRVTVDYVTLGDTEAIEILARRLSGKGPVSGKAQYRLEAIHKFRPGNAGAVPDLGVNCAQRNDGTITVIIVNKNIDEAVPVHLKIDAMPTRGGAAEAWLLTGPEPWSTNLGETANIGVAPMRVDVREGSYYLDMPACSMAAVEITPNR